MNRSAAGGHGPTGGNSGASTGNVIPVIDDGVLDGRSHWWFWL